MIIEQSSWIVSIDAAKVRNKHLSQVFQEVEILFVKDWRQIYLDNSPYQELLKINSSDPEIGMLRGRLKSSVERVCP